MPDFHRTNINLHATDVDWLVTNFGYGWTEKVRDVVHDYVVRRQLQSLEINDQFSMKVLPRGNDHQ